MPGQPYVTEDNIKVKAEDWQRSIRPSRENELTSITDPALIVVDMQRYFTDPGGRAHLPAARAIISNIRSLIGSFEIAKRPALFTRHGHLRDKSPGLMQSWWKGRLVYDDEKDAEFAPELGALPKDSVIRKQHYDAFKETRLGTMLESNGTKVLVLCGVMTDLCVETTARQAFMNGFQPVVALDATATKDEELHLAALKTLAHGFAYVETSDRIIELMR